MSNSKDTQLTAQGAAAKVVGSGAALAPAKNKYDVIVIGGGHAGTEAAAAAARMGARTVLVTHRADTVGEMSCNPAIGGIAKGTLVREIDALDGVMGRAIDRAGIHYKMLNRSKGPAVWGPRAQADRKLYRAAVQDILREYPSLSIVEGAAADIQFIQGRVSGITLEDGRAVSAGAVVLTTGTFLNGVIHRGDVTTPAGRVDEAPSVSLAKSLYALGLKMGRLKTGTPARLHRDSIDWASLEPQPGDTPPTPFSTLTTAVTVPQISCYITRTSALTKQIISENLHRSAMYSGKITGRGPRYCPSIEDKISRFADKETHQIFLEPEGLDSDLIYPNGLSTSLPEDVQHDFIHSIAGLAKAVIVRPGYAIEYDYVDPRELTDWLELRKAKGLFLAGQINGTTGYEEAGAQGLVAGANAALLASGSADHFILTRGDSYTGVMIDDLISQGVSEPYRMFTSRSEYRLHIRADNADLRLTAKGRAVGLVGEKRWKAFSEYEGALSQWREQASAAAFTPMEVAAAGITINQDGKRRRVMDLLTYNNSEAALEMLWPVGQGMPTTIREQLKIEATYQGFLEKQQSEIRALQDELCVTIPHGFKYGEIASLSNELKEKLKAAAPTTLGEAKRIQGMTPSGITALLVALKRYRAVA